MIDPGSQSVNSFNGGAEALHRRPECWMLFPDLLKRRPGGGEGGQIEAHVGSCSCQRGAKGSKGHHHIGNKRPVTVGGKPLQIPDGTYGPLAKDRRRLCGPFRCPANRALAFRPGLQPERRTERFGGRRVVVGEPQSRFPERIRPRVKTGQILTQAVPGIRVSGDH